MTLTAALESERKSVFAAPRLGAPDSLASSPLCLLTVDGNLWLMDRCVDDELFYIHLQLNFQRFCLQRTFFLIQFDTNIIKKMFLN